MYHGFWRENHKDNHGVYIWMNEEKSNTIFDHADFDAYVGDLELDRYRRGCYLSKKGDNYYVYYGNFDQDGHKNDERAFFYSSKQDKIIVGKMVNDKYVNGYFVSFNSEDGNITDIVYCEFNNDEMPIKLLKSEEIDESLRTKISYEAKEFRVIALREDYFGQLYEKYKEILAFIRNEMNDIKILDDEEGYPRIMKLGMSYNDMKLFRELEKSL